MISVVVPVFNASLYIRRFLDSLFSQTFVDFEAIFVDDCGTDGTIEILEEYLAQYEVPVHCSILHHEHNRGASAARNTGLAASKGSYVLYADCDDEITPDCLSLFWQELSEHPESEVIVGGMKSIPYREYYDLELYKHEIYKQGNSWARFQCYKKGQQFPVSPCNKLIRKDFLLKNGLLFKEGIVHEDELWVFNMCNVLESVSFIGKNTYLRYINPDSVMTSMTSIKSGRTWTIILEEIIQKIDGRYKDLMLFKYMSVMLSYFDIMKNDGKYSEVCRHFVSKLFRCHYPLWGVGLWIYVFLYPVHHGKFIWKFRDKWIPEHWKKLTDKYQKELS